MIRLMPGMIVTVPADRHTPAHTVRLLTDDEMQEIRRRVLEAISGPAFGERGVKSDG